jgi:hypothetical protein
VNRFSFEDRRLDHGGAEIRIDILQLHIERHLYFLNFLLWNLTIL